MPSVSVIIPTYNRREYVQEAIDSVLAQTYTDYEIIVVDDGSTDGTDVALEGRYSDRITYVWQPNAGESAARNRGIALAQGDYVALLDSDDLWLPHKLARQIPVIEADPELVLVFSWTQPVNAAGEPAGEVWGREASENNLTVESLCLTNWMGGAASNAVIRSDALLTVGGYDETIRLGEDYDLWLKLRRLGRFAAVQEVLSMLRLHPRSQYHDQNRDKNEERLAAHIRMLERVFDGWLGELPAGLRQRALANAHARAAFRHYAADEPAQGRCRLRGAARIDPSHWANPEAAFAGLVQEVLGKAHLHGETTAVTICRLGDSLAHWPVELPLPAALRSQAYGRIYAEAAFEAHRRLDLGKTRRCVIRAIWYDRSWLRNRGFRSISVESLIGQRLAHALRRIVRCIHG